MKQQLFSSGKSNRKGSGFSTLSRLLAFPLFFALLLGVAPVIAQCTVYSNDFSSDPPLSNAQVPGVWFPDRYPPAAFVSDAGRLKISISAADGSQSRPSGQTGLFYNTQGRQYQLPGTEVTVLKADLFIPADWATKFRRSDLWGIAYNAGNAISFYPIIGFRNLTGNTPNLFYWNGAANVNLGPPAAYNTSYTLEVRLGGSDFKYYINGNLVATVSANGSTYIGGIIMQAYNFNDPALAASYDPGPDNSYNAFWDNLSASKATVEAPNLFTAFPGDVRVPPGQQSATVCQNSGVVTFQFSNCQGGTVNWEGTNNTNGAGNIVATSANVGTVTYSATCTIGECTSGASTVSVTTTAPPTVSISGITSVVYTPTAGSNCTTLTANPVGTGPFTYSWKKGNTEIGTNSSQPVCPEENTIYTVTVTNANRCTATSQVTVNVRDVRCGNRKQNVTVCYYGVTHCVSEKIAARYLRLGATIGGCGSSSARIGVEETALDAPFSLSVKGYPNPTQGDLTLEVMSKITGPAQMQVLDLTGRAVQQRTEQLLEGRNEVRFDLTAQPSGTYLIRASDGQNRQGVIRVSKQ